MTMDLIDSVDEELGEHHLAYTYLTTHNSYYFICLLTRASLIADALVARGLFRRRGPISYALERDGEGWR